MGTVVLAALFVSGSLRCHVSVVGAAKPRRALTKTNGRKGTCPFIATFVSNPAA